MTAERTGAGLRLTRRVLRRLRRYFLVGLVVIAPVGFTLFVLVWIFQPIDAIVGTPLQRAFGRRVPGVGVIVLALLVLAVGWLAHNAVGRQLLDWWNLALVRFPWGREQRMARRGLDVDSLLKNA